MSFCVAKNETRIYLYFYLLLNFIIFPTVNCTCYAAQTLPIGGLIKVRPEKNQPFSELRLTNKDKENITFIITCMGEQGKLWLLVHKTELNERGDKIQGVHPLKFLSAIFSDEYLKKVCMPVILNDFFKKKNFIEGLGANMTKEAQKGKIQKHLPEFLQEIKLDKKHSKTLLEFVKARDWEGFVWHIVRS